MASDILMILIGVGIGVAFGFKLADQFKVTRIPQEKKAKPDKKRVSSIRRLQLE